MDRTEEGDEASQTQEQPRPTPGRPPADTGPEPSIKPGSISRTLGHIALTVLAVVVLWTAYQHSRRDDDNGNGNEGRAGADETTSTTAEDGATVTTADTEGAQEPSCDVPEGGPAEPVRQFTESPPMCIDPGRAYVATVETSKGEFEITLDAATAPSTVNNFVFLARWRYYEGSVFYHVAPGVTIGTGDPITQNGYGDPGYTIRGEQTPGPYDPILSVFMPGPDTVASEFSIVTGTEGTGPISALTRIGSVTGGDEVVRAIEATGSRDTPERPTEPTLVERITISGD